METQKPSTQQNTKSIVVNDDASEEDKGDEEENVDQSNSSSSSGSLVQDPYELSKSGTGPYHPAANELRKYIALLLHEIKHGR